MEKNAPEPPALTLAEGSGGGEELEEKEERIEELESEVEAKDERIEELESEIEDLEAQLEEGDDVVFNIDVTPSEGEEFAVDEYAVVHVESQNADSSELQVGHDGTTYEVEDGEVRIPLTEVGTQPI